jgi:hypothetical protein
MVSERSMEGRRDSTDERETESVKERDGEESVNEKRADKGSR